MSNSNILENSKKCIQKTLEIKEILKNNKLPKVNKKSAQFYKKLTKKIKQIYPKILSNDKKFGKCSGSINPNLFSSFLDLKTREEINNNTCLIKINDNIKIFSNANNQLSDSIIKTIFSRTSLLEEFFSKKVTDLTISLSKDLRQLPEYKIQLKPKNINGGWTYFTSNETGVVIYRLEEFAKVLLHELLHSFEFEISSDSSEIYSQKIKEIIEYDADIKLINETFIELGANILNSVLIPIETNKYNFSKILENERYWSLYQAAKLIVHYGFSNFYEFLKYKKCMNISSNKEICERKCKKKENGKCILSDKHPIITESTNFVSYIINRAIAFYLINDYTQILIDITKSKSNNISSLFDINNNEDSIKFVNLILDGYTNKGFITTIDFLIRYIKKNEFNKMYVSSKEFNVYNSVRMSAYELDYSHRR